MQKFAVNIFRIFTINNKQYWIICQWCWDLYVYRLFSPSIFLLVLDFYNFAYNSIYYLYHFFKILIWGTPNILHDCVVVWHLFSVHTLFLCTAPYDTRINVRCCMRGVLDRQGRISLFPFYVHAFFKIISQNNKCATVNDCLKSNTTLVFYFIQ